MGVLKLKATILTLWFCGSVIVLSSCTFVTKVPYGFLADPFGNLVQSLETQSDPELVRQGFPSFLLLIDSLVASSPEDPDLLFAAASAYGFYCQAFLNDEENLQRASKLFLRAKECGIKLLEQKRHFYTIDQVSLTEFEDSLQTLTRRDIPHLYAATTAWLGWILTNTESMEALADLPKVLVMMDRIIELDETHNYGFAHIFYGIYYAIQPRGAGQDLDKSKFHFNRAIDLGGRENLFALVTYAEYYGKATLDEALFTQILDDVLHKDSDVRPELRLMNELAHERATYLLENREDIF